MTRGSMSATAPSARRHNPVSSATVNTGSSARVNWDTGICIHGREEQKKLPWTRPGLKSTAWNGLTTLRRMYLIQREISGLLYKQLMFTSKKTEKVGRGKTAGQWGAVQEFIDVIFYWKIQLSKPETFPFPRMNHHQKKNVMRAAFSGSWVNFHTGKNPKTQNSCKLLPRRGSWAPEDSGFMAYLLSLRKVLGCHLF